VKEIVKGWLLDGSEIVATRPMPGVVSHLWTSLTNKSNKGGCIYLWVSMDMRRGEQGTVKGVGMRIRIRIARSLLLRRCRYMHA
jgi:hypothetical protein